MADPRSLAAACLVFVLGCGASKAAQRSALTEPTVAAPAPTRMLHAEIMKSMCPGENLAGATCAVCPEDEDLVGPLERVTSRPGAYSEPGAREHLVMFEGCVVYHDDDYNDLGGERPMNMYTLRLFAEGDGAFEEIAVAEGVDLGRCVFPKLADETEAIFCVEELSDFGVFTSSVVRLDPYMGSSDPYSMLTSDISSCPEYGMGYVDEELVDVSTRDVDGDGLDDVVVEANIRSGDIPDAYPNYCAASADGQILEVKKPTSFHLIQVDGDFEELEQPDP